MRILIFIICFSSIFYCCSKNAKSNNEQPPLYSPYFKIVDSVTASFSDKQKLRRQQLIDKYRNTEFYERVVIKKELNPLNLNTLHAICSGLIYMEKEQFSQDRSEMERLKQDEVQFCSSVTALYIDRNGGITREIADMFTDYKNRFGYYGKAGTIINDTSKIYTDFDITPMFIQLNIFDQSAYEALSQVYKLHIREWNLDCPKDSDKMPFIYPYLMCKLHYQAALKKLFPNSPYLIDYQYHGDAISLIAEYQENEVAADKKFKDKNILLKGKVSRIIKDIANNNVIVLAGDDFLATIHCKVTEADALSVKKGQIIQIVGNVKGMTVGSVVLDNAQLW
jgi:hypothetical protein